MRLLSETRNGRHSLYLYDEGSYDPLARVDGQGEHARLRYYHTDPNGLPQQLTEDDGRCIWQARYQVWGNTLAETQESFFVEEQNLRFQGQYLDRETGLHYNTFRFYDPDIGRFISPDPIGLAGGINLFQYAPEPYGWVDPWGWSPSSTLDRSLGGVVGDNMQAHHLIPVAVWKKHEGFLTRIGLGSLRDTAPNGLLMPDSSAQAKASKATVYHRGSHANYNALVDRKIERIHRDYKAGIIDKAAAKQRVEGQMKSLRRNIRSGKISTQKGGRLC